jgi:hypothetical protein
MCLGAGIPPAANSAPVNANGRAKTECENFIRLKKSDVFLKIDIKDFMTDAFAGCPASDSIYSYKFLF